MYWYTPNTAERFEEHLHKSDIIYSDSLPTFNSYLMIPIYSYLTNFPERRLVERKIWKKNMKEQYERKIWKNNMKEQYERKKKGFYSFPM